MPIIIAVVASALLLAAIVTELTTRFWPADYYALLLATVVALLVNGLFTARVATSGQSVPNTAPEPRPRSRGAKQGARKADQAPAAAPAQPIGDEEHGVVKWFNRSKGYGFIIRENKEEIFVHQRSIAGSDDGRQRPVLKDGQRVSYIVTRNEKGVQAEAVKPLD